MKARPSLGPGNPFNHIPSPRPHSYPDKPLNSKYSAEEWSRIVGHHEAHRTAGIEGEEMSAGNFDPSVHCNVCRRLSRKTGVEL